MKREDNLFASVRNLRIAIRERVKGEILSEYEEARKEGKYPWEGMWLTPEQINAAQEKLKKRDKVVFFELLAFFFILMFFVLPTFSNLTVSLVPRQNGKDYRKIFRGIVQQSPLKERGTESIAVSGLNDGREAGRRGKVHTKILKLREGPGISYPVISKLQYGELITVRDKKGVWLRVKTGNSLDGWVSGEYIKLNDLTGKRDFASNPDADRKSPGTVSSAERSVGSVKRETAADSEKTGSQTDAVRDNKYFIQIGAWKKLSYALKAQEKLKVQFPDVFIEYRNSMYKVRIPGILDEEQASLILKEIKENFNITPLLVRITR